MFQEDDAKLSHEMIPYQGTRLNMQVKQGTKEQTEELFQLVTELFAHWGLFDGIEEIE